MKKLIAIVALVATVATVATVAASPAFAMYDPGPTTGSAANQAEHSVGSYRS